MERLVFNPAKNEEQNFSFPGGTARLLLREDQLIIRLQYSAVYGMGEKFDKLNKKGLTVINKVEEHFCEQGEHAYCPAPFCFTDSGFGLFVDTSRVTVFEFDDEEIRLYFAANAVRPVKVMKPQKASWPAGTGIALFAGNPARIIQEYMSLTGPAQLPPEWAFGVWISANRWHTQKQVEEQLELLEKYRFPASVLVIEAWSDEATFYIWNGAGYTPRSGGEAFVESDFDFSKSELWPNPRKMIEKLHDRGLRLVLWQIPVYKPRGPGEAACIQRDNDLSCAAGRGLVVRDGEGRPYTIPEGHWFAGSLLPDFTNAETRQVWFAKRQYLLDMGVDGFKTDGGEFIYREDLVFANGNAIGEAAGAEMINGYAKAYTGAYADFAGPDRVLFSRAGFSGQHTTPILWAGDQRSSFAELQSCLRAGLSAALSGIIFWGFDIGGFAGPLPSPELYLRATELACFCPVMQWHSEPEGGQFAGSQIIGNNERSPWNIAASWFGPDSAEAGKYLAKIRFFHDLRMKLLPYILSQAENCACNSAPLMRPLVYDFPEEKAFLDIDDEFMLGRDLLIAPVLAPRVNSREVLFPAGAWRGLFDGKTYAQGRARVPAEQIPVFIRDGADIPGLKPERFRTADN
jgi:alpha-D-xyloside xylohydrolase